jgi:hypothetical protein
MSTSKRISPGWSFAAGTLVGGLAVLVPLTSIGKPGRHPAPDPAVNASAVRGVPAAPAAEALAPSGKGRRILAPRPSAPKGLTPRHCELELQLD